MLLVFVCHLVFGTSNSNAYFQSHMQMHVHRCHHLMDDMLLMGFVRGRIEFKQLLKIRSGPNSYRHLQNCYKFRVIFWIRVDCTCVYFTAAGAQQCLVGV